MDPRTEALVEFRVESLGTDAYLHYPGGVVGIWFSCAPLPKVAPGQVMDPAQFQGTFAGMAILWPIMMAAMIGLQVQGMRWMLKKARWADFRVALLPKR